MQIALYNQLWSPVYFMRAVVFCLTGIFSFSSPAYTQSLQIDPRLDMQATYTDNVTLLETGGTSDYVLSASPGLNIRGKSARIEASVDYWFEQLWFGRSGETDRRHYLYGLLDAEIWKDHLTMTARAGVSPTFLDRQQSLSGSSANISTNRRTVQNYAVAGKYSGRISNFANMSASYEFGLSLSPADNLNDETLPLNFSDSETQRFRANIGSGKRFRHFEWAVSAMSHRVSRSLDVNNFRSDVYLAEAWYKLNRKLSFVGAVGETRNDFVTDALGQQGFKWDVGMQYVPSLAADFLVRYGKEGQRETWNFKASTLFNRRTELKVSYIDILSATALNSNDALNAYTLDTRLGIVDGNGLPVDVTDPSFSLSDTDFRSKTWKVFLKWLHKRDTVYFSGSRELRTFDDLTRGDSLSWNIAAGWDHKINPRSDIGFNASFRRSSFEGQTRKDDYILASLEYKTNLYRNVIAALSLNHSERFSNVEGGDLAENAISLYIRSTF